MSAEDFPYEFSLIEMQRILKRAGAERISEDAKNQMLSTLNRIAKEIAFRAVKLASDSGKNTITEENIRDATSIVMSMGGI